MTATRKQKPVNLDLAQYMVLAFSLVIKDATTDMVLEKMMRVRQKTHRLEII